MSIQRFAKVPDALHPLFYVRNARGKIECIASNATLFSSQRRITHDDPLAYWNTGRNMRFVALESRPVAVESSAVSDDFALLPGELQEILGGNQVLVTSKTNSTASPFVVLMAEAPENQGRTGVLCRKGPYCPVPVRISICGKEFVVELKGCGTPAGGYDEPHGRSNREIVTGAATAGQAVKEFSFLELQRKQNEPLFMDGNSPRAVMLKSFTLDEYPLGTDDFNNFRHRFAGYTVRLTPSTLRMSYTNNPALVD